MLSHLINPTHPLTLAALGRLTASRQPAELGPKARARIAACHAYLHRKLAETDAPIYGINTGLGSPWNVSVALEVRTRASTLQK